MNQKLQFTGATKFWWIFMNIVTLGIPYFRKLIYMKALIDVANLQAALARDAQVATWLQSQPPESQQQNPGYLP